MSPDIAVWRSQKVLETEDYATLIVKPATFNPISTAIIRGTSDQWVYISN